MQAALAAYNTDKPSTAKVIGSENLTKPNIRAYLDKALAIQDAKPELVLAVLLNNIQSEEPVIALKSAELLGKHLRMFSDKATDPIEIIEKCRAIAWGNGEEAVDITPSAQEQVKQDKGV